MKNLSKLSLSTVTISTLDHGKFRGGKGSDTPLCSSNPPTMPKLSDNPPCTDPPSPWK